MVSSSGMPVSSKTDLRFPITEQQGHRSRNILFSSNSFRLANHLIDPVIQNKLSKFIYHFNQWLRSL